MSKYHAVPTVVDGIRFASKAEARRYGELKLAERAGRIADLELQPKFPLHVNGARIGEYRGDFAYTEVLEGKPAGRVVEDVKGMDLPLSRWKRKHVWAEYGVNVVVVRPR